MAYDKVIDSAMLDADLTAIADAIRAKTGGADKLTLDQMAADIEAIGTSENLDAVLAEQEALIEEIKVALEGKAAGGGGVTLTVTTNEGATVTISKDGTTKTGSGPVAVFEGVKAGTWRVTVELDGRTAETSVTVGEHELELMATRIYGISRDITASSPEWTRTDDAVGFTATASVGTAAGASDFDTCYPWSEMKRATLPTGDVMVKIPKFYYQRYREGNIEYIKIADDPADGFAIHPLFNHAGIETDYAYVGAYKTSSNNKSVSGAAPQINQTRGTMRTNAKAKGAGWSLIDIAAVSAIQMLILVEFANNNVQAVIGRGYCDGNTAALNTGSCDGVPNLTGRPSGTDGKTGVVYRGIEDFWGSVWEWGDGVNFNNGAYYVCNDISKYADDTAIGYEQLSFTGATNWAQAYITQEGLDDGDNAHVMLPSAAGSGSETTYQCDACWASVGVRIFIFGGNRVDGSVCGLFAAYLSFGASDTDLAVGSRLLYIPEVTT